MKSTRNYLFDNIKAFLILFVIYGHIIERYIHVDNYLMMIYVAIYSFHMPLFVFISGYFTKYSLISKRKAFRHILIPYLILNTILQIYMYFISGKLYLNPVMPGWTLWYLLSLFFWRYFLKYITIIKNIYLNILISIILGISISFIQRNNNILSFSRTISFLPYFLIGYYTEESIITKIMMIPKITSLISIVTLMSLLCFTFLFFSLDFRVLYLTGSFQSYDLAPLTGIALRLLLYLYSFIISIFFINLTPNSNNALSRIGENTAIYYIFHVYLVYSFQFIIPVFNSGLLNRFITIIALTFIIIVLNQINKIWCYSANKDFKLDDT